MNVNRIYTGLICIALVLLLSLPTAALAADKKGKKKEKDAATKTPPIAVAVLDFAAKDPGNADLGKELGEAIGLLLSAESDVRVVDRSSLTRVLQEQELSLTGLVDTNDAVKVGKLVGAKIMITGRVFPLGDKLFFTAKLIGTETSLTQGVVVKGDSDADLGELTVEVAEKVAAKLKESGKKLIAAPEAKDPVPALKAKLAKIDKPTVAVIIREQHHAAPARRTGQPIDPAVETEIKKLLTECGFKVLDVPENELTDFAKDWKPTNVNAWPRSLAKVDVLIAGEAFSEFGARIGNLVSCSSRAEINVIQRSDGKSLKADRKTTRAADLSESIAGKTALQKAGRELGSGLLEHFVEAAEKGDKK